MNFHQTEAHAQFLQSIGWRIESCGKRFDAQAFIRPLPILPLSLLKLQRVKPGQFDWDKVIQLEKNNHVYETVIELDTLSDQPPLLIQELLNHGFHPVDDYMLTTKTRIIDLNQSKEIILAAMKPKTRYNIHLAKKHHLCSIVWTMDEVANSTLLFQNYYDLLVQNAKRIKMLLLPKEWIYKQLIAFGKQGFVVGVTQKDSSVLLNAAAFFTSIDTCSYSHNGSTAAGRTLMAPTFTIWKGIGEAKRRRLAFFDFDGVYDERFPKQQRFRGFGRFKAGFGGTELYFPPMYRKYRWPF